MRKRVLTMLMAAFLLLLPYGTMALAQLAERHALSPSQAAFLKAESRRIEDHFVASVARIAGTDPERVRRAMPDERRITAAASRLISALEADLGRRLSSEQKAGIIAADEERHAALARVREGAVRR